MSYYKAYDLFQILILGLYVWGFKVFKIKTKSQYLRERAHDNCIQQCGADMHWSYHRFYGIDLLESSSSLLLLTCIQGRNSHTLKNLKFVINCDFHSVIHVSLSTGVGTEKLLKPGSHPGELLWKSSMKRDIMCAVWPALLISVRKSHSLVRYALFLSVLAIH